MVKYLGGGIIEGSSTAAASPPQTSWKELGRTTLGSAGDTIDSGTFTAKDNIMILQYSINSGSVRTGLRFNADTGNNYAHRRSVNGASDATNVNHNRIVADTDVDGTDFTVSEFNNISAQEKLGILHRAHQSGSGAGNAPDREEMVGKWANTSSQITSVQSYNAESGDFDTGSEIVVLGCDDNEADSGSNFWQELASVESTGDNHTTGTFAAKKYLWVQTNVVTTGGAVSQRMTFNDDTGSNYAVRNNFDGGSDNTQINGANINAGLNDDLVTNSIGIANMFIVNKSDQEKLGIIHTNSGEASGAGNAPTRDECVFKWANTSSQITKIDFDNNKAGDWASGSYIKVWGAD